MKYDKWNILSGDPEAAAALEAAGVPPLPALVLCARGLDTPEKAIEFLRTDLSLLPDPFLLRDMDKAVPRLEQALKGQELICVYGDYDVDGITATCLLTSYLSQRGGRVVPYVPNRLTEGYSLNTAAIDLLHEQGVSLIVTVDCGITNVQETEYAKSLGMDVIITDHHECKDVLPEAAAVINPHRPDCAYPFQSLAGVGVALKLVLAMTPEQRREQVLQTYSDLAAIGTVADVMDLGGENRAIVALGLNQLGSNCRPGLAALIHEAGQENRSLTAGAISFSLAPRINAAGRMGCPELAVQLLLTTDPQEAEIRARQLCTLNRNRQTVELAIFESCQEHLRRHPREAQGAIVLASPEWHQGVVGIVASRLSERYQAPTFMICLEQGKGKGSCRSWGQFNLFQALEQCSDLLESFGGHELAAGFTILEERIPAFRARMSALALQWQAEHPASTALTVDVLLPDARLLTREHIRSLEILEPNGTGNPTPVFALERVTVAGFSRVGGGRHTRLQLRKNGTVFDGIYFSATP
ncbi:MAG: single-stranded-DNA-specific exonuclease RecJ, partial [Oscillospiraceae bacterium]|nr:single-stranded-DNA-specific exonuclease RecJ [Oscillospiraceae bacterium]